MNDGAAHEKSMRARCLHTNTSIHVFLHQGWTRAMPESLPISGLADRWVPHCAEHCRIMSCIHTVARTAPVQGGLAFLHQELKSLTQVSPQQTTS